VIRKEPLGPAARRRLKHEVRILEQLSGVDGTAQLAEGTLSVPRSFLMVDVGGVTLSERPTPWDPVALVGLAELLARAVAGMHQRGVVHRDINPSNIVLAEWDRAPVLIDFALASTFTAVQPDFLPYKEVVGTVPYLAPEQTGRTGRSVDQRADLYALGATLYELATGTPPFGADDPLRVIHGHLARRPTPPTTVNPAVPAALSAIIMRLLEKEPGDRYQSAQGLAHDLGLLRRGAVLTRLGEQDVLARPLRPSRLVGRDREVGDLRALFAEALEGRCRGVLVSGVPGVGKTSLAHELRPIVAGCGGWFVAGKFDQYRRDLEYDGVREAFRALGRLLLAEPEESLAEVRDRMLRELGPNAGLAAAMVPELEALLNVAPEPGDAVTLQVRAQHNAVAILRAVASRRRPLVFLVDDLQWAGRTSLGFLDLIFGGDEQIEGLLLIGTYRDCDVDAVHPLAPMLARWARSDAGPRLLRLDNLTPAGQEAMIADLLGLPPQPAAQLARMIAPATGGNPYDMVELLDSLRQDGLLARGEGGWSWDADVLRRRLARVDVTGLLTARAASLPAATAEVLTAMACLAGRSDLALLRVATGLASDVLERRLAPAFAAGLLVLESDGRRGIRFHHDRTQEAVLTGLTSERRREIRLGLARRLAGRPEFFPVAAEQYLPVADAVRDEAERQVMVGLFRRAADDSRALIDLPLAERYLTAALRLIDPTETDQLLEIHIARHAALYRLGRLDEADDEYQTIVGLSACARRCAAATAVQVSSLFNRGRADDALRLGLEALGHLGYEIPAGDRLEAEVDEGLDALYQWIERTTESDDLSRPGTSDPSRSSAVELISRLIPPAFLADPAAQAWLTITALRIWAQDGPDPALIGPSGYILSVTVARRSDYRVGHRMISRILAVSRARGYERVQLLALCHYVASADPWFEPVEDSVSKARRAVQGFIQAGDLQNACFAYYLVVFGLLDCAASLDVLAAAADEALAFATRTGNGQAEEVFGSYRRLARMLRGETAEAAADDVGGMSPLADAPTVRINLRLTRALAAAILDHPADLARETAALLPLPPSYEVIYSAASVRVLRALALAAKARAANQGDREAVVRELDGLVAWLSARAADAPTNFSHLLCLVEAERAWAVGDFREAMYAFDRAEREASGRTRPWHRALILERAARFYLACGLETVGHRLLVAARDQYLVWGATAKATQLDYAYPSLRAEFVQARASAQLSGQLRGRSGLTTGTFDLLGIVAASQALSSETSIDGLRGKVVRILSDMAGATGVRLLLFEQEARSWSVHVDDRGPLSLDQASDRHLLPRSIVRYVERTHQPVVVADGVRDDRFRRDPYFTDLVRCSLLAVPVLIRGELRAILLLENRMIRGAFTTERLEGIMLIAGQLAVSLDNALVHTSLERKVIERTEQLASANRRLEQLSITDPLTGLANRRHLDEVLDAEWHRAGRQGTPLAFAMIDVDHFKSYNDHLGHAAGDRCLQRVAACLAAGVRDTDLAARYGGEEFAVVMAGTDTETAARVAHRLRAAVAKLAEPHPGVTDRIVTVSIGVVATVPSIGGRMSELVDRADAAMYDAKRDGRNRVVAAAGHPASRQAPALAPGGTPAPPGQPG
jgi:diguanylate cyclase (GGDEF)-like protein